MAAETEATAVASATKVALTRVFDAPRDRVFAAWTDPVRMARWWGPNGYTIGVSEADLRPGGTFRYCMRASDGSEHMVHGTIDEIVAPQLYTTTSFVEFEEPNRAFKVVTTVIFAEEGGRTRVSIDTIATGLDASVPPPERDIGTGWTQSLEKLAAELSGHPRDRGTAVVLVSRAFAAPPERVFDAWLDREAVGHFLFATPGGRMERVELDPRVGGTFQVDEQRDAGLAQHFGEYVAIDRPHRLIFRFATDRERAPTLVTVEIAASGDGCLLTLTHALDAQWAEFKDRAHDGWTTILDRLAQLVEGPRSAVHDSFRIERAIDAPPAKVFAAFADADAKARWFLGTPGEWELIKREFDFRPGGREHLSGKWSGGRVSAFDAIYWDIVPNQRIVYSYEMHIDARKISVSLATIEFAPTDAGTCVTVAERAAFLDGYEDGGSRERGTAALLDRLAQSIL